jgi:Phage Single-stranded DNA-binding protein
MLHVHWGWWKMNELATVQPKIGMLSHYSALPSQEGAGIMTTLDLSLRDGVVMVQQALAGESESLWDQRPDRVIRVTDLIAHYAERIDEETGETISGPMLTLIGPDGVYHTGSQFAFRALQSIAILAGPAPWNPAIKIRPVRVRSRNKREFQSLLLVE